LVKLDDNTVFNAVADGHFPSADDVPRFAVTMSTALVFEARRVLLLAYGERKQEPLYRALLGRPTPDVPISYAQTYAAGGGDLVVVVDRIAGEPLLRERQALKKRGVMLVDRRAGRAKHRVADLRFCRRLDAAGYLCR
jgi:glucosamine-6-phosphate deaminase